MIDSTKWMNTMTGRFAVWAEQEGVETLFNETTSPITSSSARALSNMFNGAFPEDLMAFYSTVTGGCKIWMLKEIKTTSTDIPWTSSHVQFGFELLRAVDMEMSRIEMKGFVKTLQSEFRRFASDLRPFMDYGIPLFAGNGPMYLICLPENPLAAQGIYLVCLNFVGAGISSFRLAESFSSWLTSLEKFCYLSPETGVLQAWQYGEIPSNIDFCKIIRETIENDNGTDSNGTKIRAKMDKNAVL